MGESISYETTNANGGCMVHVSWTLSSNVSIKDIQLFMVFFNGTNVNNETNISKTLTVRVYPVCTCGAHTINITAVNLCGNEGLSAHHVTSNTGLLSEETVCDDLNHGISNSDMGGKLPILFCL